MLTLICTQKQTEKSDKKYVFRSKISKKRAKTDNKTDSAKGKESFCSFILQLLYTSELNAILLRLKKKVKKQKIKPGHLSILVKTKKCIESYSIIKHVILPLLPISYFTGYVTIVSRNALFASSENEGEDGPPLLWVVGELLLVIPVLAQGPHRHLVAPSDSEQTGCKIGEHYITWMRISHIFNMI